MRDAPRRILWTASALAVVALTTGGAATTATAAGPKAYVDPAGACHAKAPCYRSIQVAIDRSAAGTVILAYPGTYNERVELDKALTLRGRGATIAAGGAGTLISLTSNGAAVERLALRNGDIGIGLRGATANRLSGLRIAHVRRGIFFSGGATKNLVTDTEVSHATEFAVDVGDQGDSGNRFRRLKLHDSATGFNAYRGSDNLVLTDSSIRRIAPGAGVVVGWSDGWTVAKNKIVGNAIGIVTDTVGSGAIVHNYVARNTTNGIEEAGLPQHRRHARQPDRAQRPVGDRALHRRARQRRAAQHGGRQRSLRDRDLRSPVPSVPERR